MNHTFGSCGSKAALIAIFSLFCGGASAQTTNIEITSTVQQSAVKRLGINLGDQTYWDSGQMMKNLVFRNPGFEGMTFNSLIQCGAVTANTCRDNNEYSSWPAGFWTGATYEYITGPAKGRTGTVLSSTAPTPGVSGAGVTLTLSGTSPLPAVNNYILVKRVVTGDPAAGWWTTLNGGATLSAELTDLPAGTQGRHALRVNAAAAGQSAKVSSYFDSMPGRSFVTLKGAYRLTFKAKALGGQNRVSVGVQRIGRGVYLSSTLNLTTNWQTFSLPFAVSEVAGQAGTVEVSFEADASSMLIDEVELVQTDSSPGNTTAFRDAVVNALTTLRPGVIRYMASGTALGSTLDDLVAPPMARRRAGYSAWSNRQEDVTVGLHEFLELCRAVDAEPWFVVPITFSANEMRGLIEYLSGPATTAYGSRRASRGQPMAWTDVFSTIHLELGNEAWNGVFKGASLEWPDAYGSRSAELFRAARSTASYNAARMNLMVGGQSVSPGRNLEILNQSDQYDTLAVAPYLMYNVSRFANNEELFGPLFAQPQQLSMTSVGTMYENRQISQAARRPAKLAVYEVNLHTTDGTVSQAALDLLTPSTGAGIAVADHMLLMLRELGVRDQALFALPQLTFQRSDGKAVRLWGSVVDMGVTDRKRPQFLALQLANQALAGDMLRTTHSGSNPVWNQAAVNDGVVLSGANYLQSFATADGTERALILFNLHRTAALPVTFSGSAPSGTVQLQRLTSTNITDSNETAENVRIVSQTLTGFAPANPFSLPPFSMTVLKWNGSGQTPSAPVLSNVSIRNVTTTSAVISWTTDIAGDSTVQYGPGGLVQTVNIPGARTAHSVTLTGLTPDTAYQVQARTAANGLTGSSATLTFRTTAEAAPLTISGVQATNLTTNSARVVWTTNLASSSAVNYWDGATSLTVSDPATVTTHTINLTGLKASTTYTYRVTSVAGGQSVTSSWFTFRTAASTALAISNLTSQVTGNTITLSWVTNQAATSKAACTGGGTTVSTPASSTTRTAHSVSLTVAGPGTYACQVTSSTPASTATSSVTVVVTQQGPAPAITNVAFWNINSTSATISWRTDVPADSTILWGLSSTLGSSSPAQPALVIYRELNLAGLPNGATIYFRVRSANGSGSAALSPLYSFKLHDTAGPVISGAALVSTGPGAVRVSWNTQEPATGQIEYGRSTSLGMWSGGTSVPAQSHSFAINGLTSGTWYFTIRTADTTGNMTVSAPIPFTIP